MLIGGGDKDQQTFLATVSSKGTTIRVFSIPTGEHLFEWHRGSRACQFYSLSWNGAADRLAAFGSSGTIHIFDWQKKKQPVEMMESVEGLEFEQVDEDVPARELDKAGTGNSKPLLRRIGSSIKKRATGSSSNAVPSKHRSCVKMKYKPSTAAAANSNAKASARSQPLVLALLDRNHSDDRKTDLAEREDTLALCSLDGELRQYVLKDKTIEVAQIEDVLARR
jgi:WD40 repeat protein